MTEPERPREEAGPPVEERPPRTAESAPTMIVPKDTEISIDSHGQLSIRAPGNLVLQNSGSYGTLESVSGSIRIESGVEVEAVSVKCADRCYVQGDLTAWKVAAQALQIEESGRAYIVLQETKRLNVGREARLVGNFSSEKELFLLFSRFADQVKSLPFFDRSGRELSSGDGGAMLSEIAEKASEEAAPTEASATPEGQSAAPIEVAAEATEASSEPTDGGTAELPEPLYFALVLLERDLKRGGYGSVSARALEDLVHLLRDRDVSTLQQIFRTLFSRIVEPREDVRRAGEMVEQFYRGQPAT